MFNNMLIVDLATVLRNIVDIIKNLNIKNKEWDYRGRLTALHNGDINQHKSRT